MKIKAPIICPHCGAKNEFQLSDMHPGNSIPCVNCQNVFQFEGDDMRKAQKALDDLDKSLKKLSR